MDFQWYRVNQTQYETCLKGKMVSVQKLNSCLAAKTNITGACAEYMTNMYPQLKQQYAPTIDFWRIACDSSNLNYTKGLECMKQTMPWLKQDIRKMCPQLANTKINASNLLDQCAKKLQSKDFWVERVIFHDLIFIVFSF